MWFFLFYHTTKNKNQHVDFNAIKFTYLLLDKTFPVKT